VLFLIREKGMTLGEVALWYAIAVAIGMGGGMLASGRVIDRLHDSVFSYEMDQGSVIKVKISVDKKKRELDKAKLNLDSGSNRLMRS
jgi:hypothetical protein